METLMRADGKPFVPTCHHDVFVTDDNIVPICDICNGPQYVEGDDWNGKTGNHVSCEERNPEMSEFYAQLTHG